MSTELDFATEVESGDRRRGLEAMRALLARKLEEAPARDLAALSRRLMQVMEELESLGNADPDDGALSAEDELAQRRDAVLSAAGVERTAESG
jgi:hypothetical protein